MYVLRVSKDIGPVPTKPIILIDAGIHAREWVSVSTIMYIINQVRFLSGILILIIQPLNMSIVVV